jgi:Protein of unknown function (DUF1573)
MTSIMTSPVKRVIATALVVGAAAFAVGVAVARRPAERAAERARGPFPTSAHDFGDVVRGTRVEYDFPVRNTGDQPLVLRRLAGSYGLTQLHVDSTIPPGGAGTIRLAVDTKQMRGPFDQFVNVYTADSTRPAASLHLRGRAVPPLELEPQDRVYFFTTRGEPAVKELTIINHEARPLTRLWVSSDNPAFAVRTRTLDDGRRYALAVALDPGTPVGRHEGRITITTDSPTYPAVPIPALAVISDVVSATPATVNFSLIAFDAVDMPVLGEKQILVRKHEGKDFRIVRASVDVPFLTVDVTPHAPGESFLVHVKIDKRRAKRGAIHGTLLIETNDPSFPRLTLPITGSIV